MGVTCYKVRIRNGELPSVVRIVTWLHKHKIPYTITDYDIDPIMRCRIPVEIEFESAEDYEWFALRWL